MIPDFYTPKPGWAPQVERIIEMVGRASAFDEMSGRAAELRRDAQIASVHASTAIEGSALTLQASHEDEIDAAPFIQYMLDTIEVALGSFENELLPWTRNVGMNVGMNVGIKDELLQMIIQSPAVTAEQMAQRLRKSARTVERYLAELKQEGRIAREGSRKAGRWVVIPQ